MADFTSVASLKAAGFEGFAPISELRKDRLEEVPADQGIYLVVRVDTAEPEFLAVGSGGHSKGKNPNVSVPELQANWVRSTVVLNIAKAGGAGSSSTLRKRIHQYLRFGNGQAIGHYGGRYIWQLKNSDRLLIGWKVTDNEPRDEERSLIAAFKSVFGLRPFANLQD